MKTPMVMVVAAIVLSGMTSIASAADAEVAVSDAEAFLSAIERGEKKIKIETSFTLARQKSGLSQILADADGNFLPILIPADTHIYGSDPSSQVISFRFPMQLEGNATIENVGLNFTNVTDYQRTVFMAGYTLTLNNIRTSSSGKGFDIYAGGFEFTSDAPTEGTQAHLNLNAPNAGSAGNPNPNIGVIYLSLPETAQRATFKSFNGTAEMTIAQKTRVGQVYAQGATLTVTGSGFQASTVNYLTDAETTLVLESGVTQYLTKGTFKEVVLPAGATLALTELDETSHVTIAKLTGGGTLLRGGGGEVRIEAYTGNTTVQCLAASDDVELFQTEQVPNEVDTFTLAENNLKNGYTLNYQEGTFSLRYAPYTLTLVASPLQGGVVTGGGNYNMSDTIAVRAQAKDGYAFVGWSSSAGTVSLGAEETLTIAEDVTLCAYFVPTALKASFEDAVVSEKAASLAMGGPVLDVKEDVVEVGIQLQTAPELPADATQWEKVESIVEGSATFDLTTSTLKVKLPANGKGFFRFVKADGLE